MEKKNQMRLYSCYCFI